jgi:rhodanese-related sulfurtransferase
LKQRKHLFITTALITMLVFGIFITGCSSDSNDNDANNNSPVAGTDNAPSNTPSNDQTNTPAEAPKEVVLQYVTADEVKADIEANKDIIIIDIQPEKDFKKNHIVGAIPTYAYPADTNELKQNLAKEIDTIMASEAPVYVLCPGGKTGANNTVKFYFEQGVPNERLFIIENGQKGWPHKELIESTK